MVNLSILASDKTSIEQIIPSWFIG